MTECSKLAERVYAEKGVQGMERALAYSLRRRESPVVQGREAVNKRNGIMNIPLTTLLVPQAIPAERHTLNRALSPLLEAEGDHPVVDQDLGGSVPHTNFLDYLATCWGSHIAPTIRPDLFWYTILCELGTLVRSAPETFRHLFSTSPGKQEIIIVTGETVRMPLDRLAAELRRLMPTDAEVFLPEFSTTTERTRMAFRASLCDAASPYYNYSMLMCGFPSVNVLGTADDWELMMLNFHDLPPEFEKASSKWYLAVLKLLCYLAEPAVLADPKTWKDMFKLERCGSGSQVEVDGWIRDLFLKRPSPGYIQNYPTHAACVRYKQLDTKKDYAMYHGLFGSTLEGDIIQGQTLVPEFGSIIFDATATGAPKIPREEVLQAYRVDLAGKEVPVGRPLRLKDGVWKP